MDNWGLVFSHKRTLFWGYNEKVFWDPEAGFIEGLLRVPWGKSSDKDRARQSVHLRLIGVQEHTSFSGNREQVIIAFKERLFSYYCEHFLQGVWSLSIKVIMITSYFGNAGKSLESSHRSGKWRLFFLSDDICSWVLSLTRSTNLLHRPPVTQEDAFSCEMQRRFRRYGLCSLWAHGPVRQTRQWEGLLKHWLGAHDTHRCQGSHLAEPAEEPRGLPSGRIPDINLDFNVISCFSFEFSKWYLHYQNLGYRIA